MNVSIQIIGMETVMMNNAQRGARLKHAVDIVIKKSIFAIQRFAKIASPVDTGRMRASIGGGGYRGGVFSDGEGLEFGERFGSIGPTVEYAKYVHAHVPFMRMGAQSARSTIQKVANEEIRKAMK